MAKALAQDCRAVQGGRIITEAEKDAFIVQLRGEVTKYRDAYRLTKYQLDKALKEIKELKEKNG